MCAGGARKGVLLVGGVRAGMWMEVLREARRVKMSRVLIVKGGGDDMVGCLFVLV